MTNTNKKDKKTATASSIKSSDLLDGWISIADQLPETKPCAYMREMSEIVLVCGNEKNNYPWVAHLHVDKAVTYKEYAWGVDRDGVRYTWLNPYRDISDQKVTHWQALPSTVVVRRTGKENKTMAKLKPTDNQSFTGETTHDKVVDVDSLVRCADCKYWGDVQDEWYDNARPCQNNNGRFYVDGGDCTDGLYTQPTFGCVDGERI